MERRWPGDRVGGGRPPDGRGRGAGLDTPAPAPRRDAKGVGDGYPLAREGLRRVPSLTTTMETHRMSPRKALVERYIDGFRRGDHEQILSCLTDDIPVGDPRAG